MNPAIGAKRRGRPPKQRPFLAKAPNRYILVDWSNEIPKISMSGVWDMGKIVIVKKLISRQYRLWRVESQKKGAGDGR